MDTRAFDLLMVMTSVSQVRDRPLAMRLFIEGLRELFPRADFEWSETEGSGEEVVEISTRRNRYGFLLCRNVGVESSTVLPLIQNAGQMLAVILEKLHQEKELQERTDSMEAFSSMVSHDLRAPLRAINGYAKIFKEDFGARIGEEENRYLDRILAGAERMSQLIEALLYLARLEKAPVAFQTVDVQEIVTELFDELEAGGVCSTCNGRARCRDFGSAPLPSSLSDPRLLRQVFANIVGNACKFTRKGEHPRIRVLAEEREDGIWYSVSDNGCGFDMAHRDKLFQSFQRLHDDSVEGIGIGLATVKRILERLGGEIDVESGPGMGATFRFRAGPPRPPGA